MSGRGLSRRCIAVGACLAACPDLDAIGYWAGVPYGSTFGHRGITHSVFFAACIALVATVVVRRRWGPKPRGTALFGYFFSCAASHGVLDAFTNGGLGVAFWSPFSGGRHFFCATPIAVAPLSPRAMFGEWGLRVMLSELLWVCGPAAGVAAIWRAVQCRDAA